MAQCITCGAELHPERAQKYDYCMAPACQEKNAKGLTMVAIGMNKAADELMLLDDRTRADLASGRYRDQRRGFFGPLDHELRQAPRSVSASAAARLDPDSATTPAPVPVPSAAGPDPAAAGSTATATDSIPARPGRPKPRPKPAPAPRRPIRPPWTGSQQRLTLLYNSQGLQPAEIAQKVGLSRYQVTQIILAAKNRGKA